MKKAICTILTIVLILGTFVPTSFAATHKDYRQVVKEVEEINEEIEELIDQAVEEAQAVLKSGRNPYRINRQINRIIIRLVRRTDRMSARMVRKAARVGIVVICEYVEVTIGNQKVLVDPLRVIGF